MGSCLLSFGMRTAQVLVWVILGVIAHTHGRPSVLDNTKQETPNKNYLKFFNIKELIEKINIKRFREFLSEKEDDHIPTIDVSEEAITHDKEIPNNDPTDSSINSSSDNSDDETEITTAPTINLEEDMPNDTTDEGTTETEESELTNRFFISEESINAARKYGYKILLKKINGKVQAVGKIRFEVPTLIEIHPGDDDVISDDDKETAVGSNPAVTDSAKNGAEEATSKNAVVSVEATTQIAETTVYNELVTTDATPPETAAPVDHYLAPAEAEEASDVLSDYISNEVDASSSPIMDSILELAHNVVDVMEKLDPETNIILDMCALSVKEVEKMLHTFAENIESSLPTLQEILNVGSYLAGAATKEKAKIGAQLLTLLEDLLESIVPFQISGCGEDGSNAMISSISSVASQLDSLANYEVNARKAKALHSKATSLQLSSWGLIQLKHAVKLFYSQDGICKEPTSKPSVILNTLSKAVQGYVPLTTIVGNQDSVKELQKTAAALKEASEELTSFEESGAEYISPVSCASTFGEMAQAVVNAAEQLP